ncbi:hypothetical protein FORC53_1297 [Vibrio vulnificus]|uniref:Uncharacterized protein n=2 Tax=Vibrio vulnificus TaxID=672 RepID=A0AAN1UBR8_VIBVL|nr:hypothetical protein FORC53_1297 [Vibrio vulnificus]
MLCGHFCIACLRPLTQRYVFRGHMSLEQIDNDVKIAVRWSKKFIYFVSKTKLRSVMSSVIIAAFVIFIPKYSAFILAKDIYDTNMPKIELANAVYKKGQLRYLIDLLEACINVDVSDKNKDYYCSVAKDFYRFSVEEKFMIEPDETLRQEAFHRMKADATFLINELDYKLLSVKQPDQAFTNVEFIFDWWLDLIIYLFACMIGFLFYVCITQLGEVKKT